MVITTKMYWYVFKNDADWFRQNFLLMKSHRIWRYLIFHTHLAVSWIGMTNYVHSIQPRCEQMYYCVYHRHPNISFYSVKSCVPINITLSWLHFHADVLVYVYFHTTSKFHKHPVILSLQVIVIKNQMVTYIKALFNHFSISSKCTLINPKISTRAQECL